MKKLFTSLAVGAILIASIPSTVSAAATINYAACTVNLCNIQDTHQHEDIDNIGISYSGHTITDGHSYHQLCTVTNCTLTANHDHDGETYFAHHSGDGHTYHTEKHNNTGGGHNRHHKGGHH